MPNIGNGTDDEAGPTTKGTGDEDDGADATSDGDDARGAVVARATGVEHTYDPPLPAALSAALPVGRSVEVLDGVDLELRAGEIVGIVGENGSGKSTLLEVLVGALEPDAGEVAVDGRVGWCPQEPLLYDRLTVAETFRLFGTAYGMDGEAVRETRDRYADRLGFEAYLDYRVDRLSGGNRQKVNLAVALLPDPDVLVLDEPYTGFDWRTYLAFWELTEALTDRGTAIVVVSHFVSERERFDRILELSDGRLHDVTGDEPTERASDDPRGAGADARREVADD